MATISPAEYLMNILASASPPVGAIGAATGWRIGYARMLDDPDTQIVFYDSPGEHPDPKWLLDYPYVQVLVRGAEDDVKTARQKTRDVYDVLLGIFPTVFANGDRLDAITVVGTPSFIGNDQKNRPSFSTNFRLIFEPAPTPYATRLPL